MRKWHSNRQEALRDIQVSETECSVIQFSPYEFTKTLGLTLACQTDQLSYVIQPIISQFVIKRTVLSTVASIFDPLELVSPCTIIAKIIIQELWSAKQSWDQALPDVLSVNRSKLKTKLPILNNLLMPRCVVCPRFTSVELHGFSDASERAYGACDYIRSVNDKGESFVWLL